MANLEVLQRGKRIVVGVLDRLNSGYQDKKDQREREEMWESAQRWKDFGDLVARKDKLKT